VRTQKTFYPEVEDELNGPDEPPSPNLKQGQFGFVANVVVESKFPNGEKF
jgi:hypothetical protein